MRRSLTLAAAVAVFLLTGCAAAEPDDPMTSNDESDPTETVLTVDDCLVGDWSIGADDLRTYYENVFAAQPDVRVVDVQGDIGYSFAADGTFVSTPAFGLDLEVAGITARGEGAGELTGTWTTDAPAITTVYDSSDVDLAITIDGLAIDTGEMFDDAVMGVPTVGSEYDCSGTEPILYLGYPSSDFGDDYPATLRRG